MNKISQIVDRYQNGSADEKVAAESSLLLAYEKRFQRLARYRVNDNPDLDNAVEDLQQSYALSLITFLRDFVDEPEAFDDSFNSHLRTSQAAPSNSFLPLETLRDKWVASAKELNEHPSWFYGFQPVLNHPEILNDVDKLRGCFHQAAEHILSIDKKGHALPEKTKDQRRVALYHALLVRGYDMGEDFLPDTFRETFTGDLKSRQDIATHFGVSATAIQHAISGTPRVSLGYFDKFCHMVFRDPVVRDHSPELFEARLHRVLGC